MIFMIDHISFVTDNFCDAKKNFDSTFSLKFSEESLVNTDIKKIYLKNNHESHSIYFYQNDNWVNVEVILYDKVLKGNCYTMNSQNYFSYLTSDVSLSKMFWSQFNFQFFNDNLIDSKMVFKDLFGKKDFFIEPIFSDNVPCVSLDTEGYSCLTFVSNNIDEDRRRLLDNGYKCSKCSELKVKGNEIRFFFVEGPCGELVEIISL
jgi:hypothetical protein